MAEKNNSFEQYIDDHQTTNQVYRSERYRLSQEVETNDKYLIESFLEGLDVELPEDVSGNQEWYLEGEIKLAEGYEASFPYDLIKGEKSRARFAGEFVMGELSREIDTTYMEKATEVFSYFSS